MTELSWFTSCLFPLGEVQPRALLPTAPITSISIAASLPAYACQKLSTERVKPREHENPMFIGVFGPLRPRIQSRFPKPGVAGSNPAEGADRPWPLSHL